MSISNLLQQTAVIQTRLAGQDRLGVQVDDWQISQTDVPCRLKRNSGQQIFDDNQRGVVRLLQAVNFEAWAGIDESMRILQITNANGSAAAGDMTILSVYPVNNGDGMVDHLIVQNASHSAVGRRMTAVAFTWTADEVLAKAKRAHERALVAFGYSISQQSKTIVHKVTGTLGRSIHIAQDSYSDSIDDLQHAKDHKRGGDELDVGAAQGNMTELVTWTGSVGSLSVGSWLEYAQRIETRYPYMAPTIQSMQGRFLGLLQQAMSEEGLA